MAITRTPATCPHCRADLRGEPIPPEERPRHGGLTHYSRLIGVEVQGAYDGILLWRCPDCLTHWPRFPRGHRLHTRAQQHLARTRTVG